MTIQDELLAIKGSKELLDPKDVYQWAEQNPESELYSKLQWDNEKAGYAYRMWQIRQIIAVHIVVVPGERKLISLSIDRKVGGGYRDLQQVSRKPNLEHVMIVDALDEIERVVARFRHIKKLTKLWKYLDVAIATWRKRYADRTRKAA